MRVRCLSLLAGAVLAASAAVPPPPAELPPGFELLVAAAPPLVNHPIMGCLDDRGRLYVGDAAGVNLDRAGLEQQLPHRVLRLVDTDGDGVYDRVTVFADRLTFPQGGAWLAGSLYVASPPGIWKFTDTDDDGVADRREMIVGGFDFDGNAADVHGPFLHPTDGRLYWCHGRKGHRVVQRDGTLVHAGKAAGVWSCRPDGSDIQWHALGGMDNPVELDFTPDGQLLGVVNLHFNQPRQDTLVHWLYGGVYTRPDQLAVTAGLPRTVAHLPVVHSFGHVAVAGTTFYRSGVLDPAWRGDLFVTFFNSQKVVRTHLVPSGATFTATQHDFLRLDDPDAHLTDVLEDRDGSLLVLNTGGWFRLGCPTSLSAKPDLRGAVYRIRATQPAPALAPLPAPPVVTLAAATDAPAQLRACEALARAATLTGADRTALLALLAQPLDAALEHAAMFAALRTAAVGLGDLSGAPPLLARRLFVILDQTLTASADRAALLAAAEPAATAADPALATAALALVAGEPAAFARLADTLGRALAAPTVPAPALHALATLTAAHLATPTAQELLTGLLAHPDPAARATAWRVLAAQPGKLNQPAWTPLLVRAFAAARNADLPLLLDVIGKLGSAPFAPALRKLADDDQRAPSLRLRALGVLTAPNEPLDSATFDLLFSWCQPNGYPLPRLEAARLLARARLTPAQLGALAPVVGHAGPLELREFLKLVRRLDTPLARTWARALAASPVFATLEESVVKSAFSAHPAAVYEELLAPAARAATAADAARRRRFEQLAANLARGRAERGENVFEFSACVACHHVGPLGRVLGPDLTHIGRTRRPRDLLESIFYPDATIARDFETHAVETTDGRSLLAVQQSAGDTLLFVDVAGREFRLRPDEIAVHSVLPTSLMPAGLEQTFNDEQLLDLIAWLAAQR